MIFDDAAVFPPGNLSLGSAVLAHRRHRSSWYADLVGPLVVPAAALVDITGPLDVAVVVPDATAAAAVLTDVPAGVRVVALEVTDGTGLRAMIGDPDGVTVHVEVPRGARRDAVIAGLAGSAYRGKLRTGGVRADLHPDEAELAATLVELARADVRFKATAGLHHALRNTAATTGFEQHGFLNLDVATAAAEGGIGPDEVAALLAVRDAERLPAVRSTLLTSIGTCSILEPVVELTGLGLLAGAR